MALIPVVIIGAGPAGITAAVQCSRLGVSPLLLDSRGEGGGLLENAFRVENYPGLATPLDGPSLVDLFVRHLDRFHLSVENAEVSRVECLPSGGFAVIARTRQYDCRAVVLATGTSPRPLSFQGCSDAEATGCLHYDIRPFVRGDEQWPGSAAIIGGGEAALDYALSLSARGAKVDILIRNHELRANLRLRQQAQDNPSIRLRFGHQTLSVERKHCGVHLVGREVRPNGETAEFSTDASCIIGAIGRQSRAPELLPCLATTTGEFSLTPMPGLFICGDARLGGLGQTGIAVGDGLYAAAMIHKNTCTDAGAT